MLVGVPPYFDKQKSKLFENIQSGPLKIPHTMPQDARQIILSFLNRNPSKRLGSNDDVSEIKNHEFFKSIDWKAIEAGKGEVLAPTIRPIKFNPQSMKQFLEEEKESKQNFADFERTNLKMKRGNQGNFNRPANIENWSFVKPASARDDLM